MLQRGSSSRVESQEPTSNLGDLYLERTELVQVATTSHTGTMCIMPEGKKKTQKFVVGDDSGTVHLFEMKRGEAQVIFKFKEIEGMVTAVTLGGTDGKYDKIFATQGSKILGINKKGKEFFRLTSSLSETIHHMEVVDTRIWTGCEYIYNLYDDGRDAAFVMCHDRINALTIANITSEHIPNAVLGCQDQCVRVVHNSEVVCEAKVDGAVQAVAPFDAEGTGAKHDCRGIIYGTATGVFGHLRYVSEGRGRLQRTWQVKDSQIGVCALQRCDLGNEDKGNMPDLVVARDNGTLQVYSVDSIVRGAPELRFEASLEEKIQSVQVGAVSSPGFNEIVVCTYSGKVIGFTTEPLRQADPMDHHGRTLGAVQHDNKMRQLQKEILELEKKIQAGRDQLASLDPDAPGSSYLPLPQQFQVVSKCALDPDEAAWVMSLEAPVPLDTVVLQSPVHMDLLEVRDEALSKAIVSTSPPDPETGGVTLATFRCQEDTSRLVIKARTMEGDYGDVVLTVVAKSRPERTAQVVRFKMRPLSLHHRLHVVTEEDLARPKNTLKITGGFSLNVMHDWVGMCLPEVPPRVQEESVSMHFRNVFTRSVLALEYRRGEALISSDSVSALAIIKEVISREATARRISISDVFTASQGSVPHFLTLLHPKLQAQSLLARQVELLEAVKEIAMQEAQTPWLSPDYREILERSEQIQKEFKERPRALEYLTGIVTDLFVDWHKFQGHDLKHQIPVLQGAITSYNYDQLLSCFHLRAH